MFIDFTLFIFTLIVLNDVFNDKLQSEQILNTEIKQISLLLSFLHLKSFVFRFHDKTLSPLITFHIYISQPKIPRAQVLSLFLMYVVATPHPGVRFYRSFSYARETRVEHFHRDRVCRVVELMHGSFTIVDNSLIARMPCDNLCAFGGDCVIDFRAPPNSRRRDTP